MTAPYWWKHLCAPEDAGRPEIAQPWIIGDRIYGTNGVILVSGPAKGHRIEPADPPRVAEEARKWLENATRGTGLDVRLWTLLKWSGPLPTQDSRCDACGGLGLLGWVATPGDDGFDFLGPDSERPDEDITPGNDCHSCDGTGWRETPAEPVSLYSVLVDAKRLSRALWALPRLDPYTLPGIVRVTCCGDHVGLRYGDGLAVVMGMDGKRVTVARAWPVGGGVG